MHQFLSARDCCSIWSHDHSCFFVFFLEMRTICQGTEHMAWAPNKKGSNWRQMQHRCNQFILSFMRRTFYWGNDFDSDLTLIAVYSEKQVLDSDCPVESGSNEKTGAHIENRCRCAGAERSAQTPKKEKKRKGGWPGKSRKTLLYESDSLCSAHVCLMEMVVFRIEGGYDSLHPLDQWLRFGEQPSPDTETTAHKQPSAA